MSHQVYHDGELFVQERTGERDMARRLAGAVSPRIVPGALPFLARQRVLAISAAGEDGALWTSVWAGRPGFVQSGDGERVTIATAALSASPVDPVRSRLGVGGDAGLLAIEFATRRRLRI